MARAIAFVNSILCWFLVSFFVLTQTVASNICGELKMLIAAPVVSHKTNKFTVCEASISWVQGDGFWLRMDGSATKLVGSP